MFEGFLNWFSSLKYNAIFETALNYDIYAYVTDKTDQHNSKQKK